MELARSLRKRGPGSIALLEPPERDDRRQLTVAVRFLAKQLPQPLERSSSHDDVVVLAADIAHGIPYAVECIGLPQGGLQLRPVGPLQ